MIEVIVDASLFAIPNAALSKEEAEEIIFRIQEISEWMTENYPVRFAAHSHFDGHLANLYPDRDSIEQFLELTGLHHIYSSRDIHGIYTEVIQRIERFDRGSVGEVAHFEGLSADLDLAIIQPEHLASAFKLTIVTAAYRKQSGLPIVVSSPAPWKIIGPCRVKADTIYIRNGNCDENLPIESIEDEIVLISDINSIFTQEMAEAVWKVAYDSCGIYSAIWIGAGAYALINNKVCPPEVAFKVGEHFYETAIDNQCALSGRFSSTALKTCIYYLYDPMVVSKRSFEGVGKRLHDNAEASRSHITTGNPALRLLTWDSPVGHVEFANIGPKKELRILSGRPGSAFP